MALTKSILTGRVVLPTDAAPINAELVFTLSGLDSEGGDILPPGDPARCVLINGELPPGYSIWRNTEGYRGTHYIVTVMWTDMTRHGIRETIRELGKIQVGDDASYVLADLLAEGTVPAGETFWSAITEAEYDAVIDAAASAAAAAESMTAVMDFVTVAAEPIWASSRMKFVTDAGQWWAKRVNLMVVGGQSNRVRYSITPGAGESQGNVFVWNGSAWLVATPALIGDITYVEAHRVSLVEGRPVFVVHGAVAGTAIARWVPGGDLFDALKASAIAAMADLASRGYQISRRVYDFSQGEGEYDLAPLHSLSTFRYPAFINGVRGADYLGSGCQIIITELLRQSMGGTTDRVNREWQRLISAGYTGVHLAPSDGLATEDPTDGSVQVVHFNPAGRIEMGLRCADIQLGLSNGVTSGDVAGRITATTERIWKERAYTWLGVINIGAGNVNNQVLNLLTAITGTPILWEVGGVTTEIASGVTASTYTYVGASDTQIVIWGPTDANYDQAMGFSAVATPGQGAIRSFVLNPLAHLKSVYISGHSGLMHNVNPSTWGKRMETFRLNAAPLVTFDSFVAADMPKALTLLSFTSTTPVPVWVSDAITAENTKRSGAISVTIGGTPAGFRKGNHFSVFSQLTTAIANGYRESNGQIITIGDAGAQSLYWLIADTAAAGVGGIAPAGWKIAGGSISADLTVLVPSQYPTVQSALNTISSLGAFVGKTITVLIESGHNLTHGWSVKNADLRRVRIASVDPVVYTVASGFVPVSSSIVPESTNAIAYYENCAAPALSCLIEGRGTDAYDGMICYRNVSLQVDPGCGVQNTRMNFEMRQGGELSANFTLWSNSRRACMRLTNGVQFSIAVATLNDGWTSWALPAGSFTDANLHISRGSSGQAQGVIINGSGASCVTVRRSFASILDAALSNCGLISGSTTIAVRHMEGGIVVGSGVTYNGVAITEANLGTRWVFNQPNPSGMFFNENGMENTGIGALGSRLPVRNDDLDRRIGFETWSGPGWGPGTTGGGVLPLMRSDNVGAAVASHCTGSAGQNKPRLYAKSTSGITSDWGAWEELLHTGNTGETYSGKTYRRDAITAPGGTFPIREINIAEDLLSVAITTAEGSLFSSSAVTVTFPEAFATTPNVMATIRNSSGTVGILIRSIIPSTTGFNITFLATSSTTVSTLRITYSAIGVAP